MSLAVPLLQYLQTWTQLGHLKRAKLAKYLRKINSEMREFRRLISKIPTLVRHKTLGSLLCVGIDLNSDGLIL